MGVITVSVVIDAGPEAIWDHVEQIERHTDWMADADRLHFVGDQRRGAGTCFDCETRFGPVRLTDRMTVTAWEPPHRMAVEHSGMITGNGEFIIDPVNAVSSRFTWTESLSFPWFLGGRLGERLGGTALLAAVWRRNLRALKTRVEAGR